MRYPKSIFFLFFVFVWTQTGRADNYVVINQVMYDTPLNEQTNISPSSNGEYIELYNAGGETVSLQGWRLTGSGTSEIYTFGNNITIPAGTYLILACRRGTNNTFLLSDLYDLPESTNYTIVYQNKIVLANNGESLTLYNALNDTVDWMCYPGSSSLHADNPDNPPGDSCLSLHRTYVEFDESGKVILDAGQWQAATVSFAHSMLPYASYMEENLLGTQDLPSGENYILTVSPLDPIYRVTIEGGHVSVCHDVRTRAVLQYFDGLGREDEAIALSVTPDKRDVVSVSEYRDKCNVAKQWLPVVTETEGQRVAAADVGAQAQTDYADNRPYYEVQYEHSALMRPLSRTLPGSSFADYSSQQIYGFNHSGEQVRIYTVKNGALHTDGSCYAAAMLRKQTVSDEDGKSLTVYMDKNNRKIMERRNDSTTYYVYDDLGRLRFVLPNLPPSKLSNGNYNPDNAILKARAYCYQYDSLGNMIYKRLPGCAHQLMVYNNAGQLVLQQDGNLRAAGKWTMCAYDTLGRNLYVAEVGLQQTHEELISLFANQGQIGQFESFRFLTVNYYDDYAFRDTLPAAECNALSFAQLPDYGEPYGNVTGLLTGMRVYNLSENGSTVSAFYYDADGRMVQSRSLRSTDGYKTVTGTKYLFDGSVLQRLSVQSTDTSQVQETYRYTYDHAGRAKKVYYKLDNDAEITLSKFSYDSIGHLAQNLLHNHKDIIRYSYDMRNMLTETKNRHFSERLFYADSLSLLSSSAIPCHNGNISAAQVTQTDTSFAFLYTYDALNRLVESREISGNQTNPSEWFQYDAQGNILRLQRYSGPRLMDHMEFQYQEDGNLLKSVNDYGADADRYAMIEYLDHHTDASVIPDMQYDANGNLISDLDRGISVIHYNILNLPDTIQFITGNQIINLYDAAGQKYKSISYVVPATAITPRYEIVHNYTFDVDTLEYFVTEYNGNIEYLYSRNDTTRRIHNAIGYYTDSTYYHYIKDHLGNICGVVDSNADTLIQSTIYYASGVPMAQNAGANVPPSYYMALGMQYTKNFGRDKQPYLYNGKEFIEMSGLNTYDYGFRSYYAPAGRFTSIDPLAEQTPWQSPYAYAGNRFVNAIDWMGLSGITGFSHDYNLIVVNGDYDILYVDMDHWDQGVYLCDEEGWEFTTYWDILRFELIGSHDVGPYHKEDNIRGKFNTSGGGYYNKTLERWINYGTRPIQDAVLMSSIFHTDPSVAKDALLSFVGNVINDVFLHSLYNKNIEIGMAKKILNPTTVLLMKGAQRGITYMGIGAIAYDMFANGVNIQNTTDAIGLALAEYLTYVVLTKGVTGLVSVLGTGAAGALGLGALVGMGYLVGVGLAETYNELYARFAGWEWMGNYYEFK